MPRKWWVLLAVACGTFMATLDASIVNIALSTLTKSLNADLPGVKWVVVAYFLVITCLLLPVGKISDQFGRKRVFALGFGIFILGSALCGISLRLEWLIVFRILQALGAAMLMANGPAIITAAFPIHERGRALGTLAMVVSVGLISGPGLGGALIANISWRSIFLINVPVGIIGLYLVAKFVDPDPPTETATPGAQKKFDWSGAILQAIALICLAHVFEPGLSSEILRWTLGAIALSTMILFFKVEKKAHDPIFDLSLLQNRTFVMANLAGFLIFVAYSAVAVLLPYFMESHLNLSTHQAGMLMTALPLTIFVIAPISGRISDRYGSRELCFFGALIETVTLLLMAGAIGAGLHKNVPTFAVASALCAIGLGMGLFQSPNNSAVMSTVPIEKLGIASAVIATVRNLGLVFGAGLATGIFSWRVEVTSNSESALHTTYWVCALIALGATIASLGKEKGPHHLWSR